MRRTYHHTLTAHRHLNYERHLNCVCGAVGRPCIGFALGRTEDHQTSVADPSECRNLPKEAKAARNLLQQFIESSPHPPYEKLGHTGFWYTASPVQCKTLRTLTYCALYRIVPGERPSCVPLEPVKVA